MTIKRAGGGRLLAFFITKSDTEETQSSTEVKSMWYPVVLNLSVEIVVMLRHDLHDLQDIYS